MLVLVVEDDRNLAANIMDFLAFEDIECDYAERGEQALNLIEENRYDAIVLDINLPGMDGFSVCQRLRERQVDIPILMLTARDTLDDKRAGFNAGTDDYLVKPFELAELELRLIALSKRIGRKNAAPVYQIADLCVDEVNHSVTRSENTIELTHACWKILLELVKQSPNVVKWEQLELILWPDQTPPADSLKAHMYTLRKLIDKPYNKKLLQTVRGVGCSIRDDNV